jgi:hypothetical protein
MKKMGFFFVTSFLFSKTSTNFRNEKFALIAFLEAIETFQQLVDETSDRFMHESRVKMP